MADVVESMSAMRPYREGLGIDVALEEITRHSGSKFDADVVNVCVDLFNSDEFGWHNMDSSTRHQHPPLSA